MDAINETHNRDNELALVCSIGGKPQVATFALDVLLRQGANVKRLHVIHLSTDDPRVGRSVRRRRPFVLEAPRGPAARGVRRLARTLIEERQPRAPRPGFFAALGPRGTIGRALRTG